MQISLHLQPDDIIAHLAATDKEAVITELAARVATSHPELDQHEVATILLERERLGSTGIGDGIAIPHGKLHQLREPILALGRSREGVEFNAIDDRKVNLLLLLLVPDEEVGLHLKMLARISRLLKDPAVRQGLLDAPDAVTIAAIVSEQERRP